MRPRVARAFGAKGLMNMPETLAATYKLLDEAEQKEVMDFVYFVISRRQAASHEKASNDELPHCKNMAEVVEVCGTRTLFLIKMI